MSNEWNETVSRLRKEKVAATSVLVWNTNPAYLQLVPSSRKESLETITL